MSSGLLQRNNFAAEGRARSLLDGLSRKLVDWIGTQRYLTIQLDITNACNLRCVHCYHPDYKNEGALTYDDWREVLRQYASLLDKLHLKPAVTFCGGEPMTSGHLKPLLLELTEQWPGIDITILTNGTVIRPDLAEIFEKTRIHFQVSLDGPDATRHDQIRGAGNFARTLRGIDWLRRHNLDVFLLSVLSKKTAPWVPEFFDLGERLGVSSVNFTRFIPEGYGSALFSSGADRPLEPLELKDAIVNILEHSRRTGLKTDTSQPLFALIDPKLGRHGMFGFQGLIVDYQGNLKVSSRSRFVLGNVLKEGLENLFLSHPLMRSLRSGRIEECRDCKLYARCGGNRTAAYAATGSFLAPDPGCWLLEERKQRRVS